MTEKVLVEGTERQLFVEEGNNSWKNILNDGGLMNFYERQIVPSPTCTLVNSYTSY